MILDKDEVRALYGRIAGKYDLALIELRLTGLERQRSEVIKNLKLDQGQTVVDLGCGTGLNLHRLVNAVGPSGRVIGVDISAVMLGEAEKKVRAAGYINVELIEADLAHYRLPPGSNGVLATFALEMVPEYDAIIERIASHLPRDGRLGLMGLKYPESWPEWLVKAAVLVNKPFGASKDYRDFRPWISAAKHMNVVEYRELVFGAAYRCVAASSSA